MDDFNLSYREWGGPIQSMASRRLSESLLGNSLIQMIKSPKRDPNILDSVLCTDEDMIERVSVSELFSTSDHRKIHSIFNFSLNILKTWNKYPILEMPNLTI